MFRSLTILPCAVGTILLCWSASAETTEPTILWSEPQNGLSLGIEKPSAPLIFAPTKGWKGPLVVTENLGPGRFTFRANPAGEWSGSALINVYLKNTSDKVIKWSSDRRVEIWRITLSGESGNPKTEPFPCSIPPGLWRELIQLEPGKSAKMEFHVRDAAGMFGVWGPVPEGDYVIKVSYAPNRLLNFATGGEGHWVHPYDVPGFWKGTISTPPLNVKVKHP